MALKLKVKKSEEKLNSPSIFKKNVIGKSSKNKHKKIVIEANKYKDLREVMDYKRNLTMFYSGVEYDVYLKGCYDMGVRNFLMSFQYLNGRNIEDIVKQFSEPVHLFIDSGAHTYQNDPKYSAFTVEDWEKRLIWYLKWAEKYKDSIFAIASFDFENMMPPEVVERWNKEYFEPFMLRTGIPVCFVWHQASSKSWEYYCQRYPYVGFSSINDMNGETIELNEYKEKIHIAQKYNTLVHGFAMTRTSILPQLPFYSVDSTSWKVGMRYGLLSVWNDEKGKVQQFKKDAWDKKAVHIVESYKDIDLDIDKLREYDEPEVIRASVYAYMKAEKFIQNKLKNLEYWRKAKAQKTDLNNLPPDFFPTVEWLLGKDKFGREEYAKKLNINPEYEGLDNLITDVVTFLNWNNPEYAELTDWYKAPAQKELVVAMHDTYINRIVPNEQARYDDLVQFFRDCVSGENDRLLQVGTNFDRVVKEREAYVEEETEELVDLSPDEIKERVKGLLPSPKDEETEISSLDEEVYKEAGIVPTFDERGKFVKGQVAVRKPKKVYSAKFPKFACDTCYAADKCPEYKAGYACAYNKMFNRFNTRDMGDIIEAIQGMAEHNLARMQRAMVLEVINGTIDGAVTMFIDQNTKLLGMLKSMYEYGNPETLRQTKILRVDGTNEEHTVITNPQQGGILEKIFGNMPPQNEEKSAEVEKVETVDAEVKEIENKEDKK